jgi:hypothetical protein
VLAPAQLHTGNLTEISQHALNAGIVAEPCAIFAGNSFERAGKRREAAIDEPDAFGFDMRNQHQCRWCMERRGATVSSIAPKKLAKARIGEKVAKDLPQRFEWSHHEQVAGALRRNPHRQPNGTNAIAAHKGLVDTVMDAFCFSAEAGIAARGLSARECANGVFAGALICEKVKAIIAPGMACKYRSGG